MRTVIFIVLVFISFSVKGQSSAESYFNSGAQNYAEKNLGLAMGFVDEGLRNYPLDTKLKKLKEILEEEKKKQKEQEENNKNEDKNNEDKKEGDKDKDKNGGEDKEDEKKKPQDEKDDKGKQGDKKDDKDKQPPKPQQGRMSPQQMKNLLEAMNNQEQKVQEKMNAEKQKGIKVKTDKDW